MTSRPAVRFLDRTTPPHVLTLVLLAGLAALSMNMFLPSLPAMADYFATDYRLIQLSVSLYLAINGALQVVIGPISDRYGRRAVMMGSIGVFLLATLGTIFAPTIEIFLAFRALQAVIVAGIVIGRAVVRDMVPQEEAASMLGYVTMGMALVPMVAPLVGGVLEEIFSWHASFVTMFLCGALTLWLVWHDMGETAVARPASFAAQFRQYPELLTARRFWGYCATLAFASGAFFAFLGGAPYVGTEVYGLSASALGFYFGAPAAGYALGNYFSGRFSVRIGVNRMVLWGSLITSAGMTMLLALELMGETHPIVFFGFMTTVGLGNGLVIPNASAGMLSVRPQLAGSASGLGGAMMLGGGAALSAFAGTLLSPGSGSAPLIALMLATALAAVASIAYVIVRERQVGVA